MESPVPRFRYDADGVDDVDDHNDHTGATRRSRRPYRPEHTPEPFTDEREQPGITLSTYPEATHGPAPTPAWVITSGNAVDLERGPIKTGKEADVHLVERRDPDTGQATLLAAKRYRAADHRLFHRDAGYLEGRRTRRSRETRAMANRTEFGRRIIAEQWAATEFDTLGRLWTAGVAVPYPVQLDGNELLLEFIGDAAGLAAPRLAEVAAGGEDLTALWNQCVDAVVAMGAAGYTHGDLSAYNVLVDDGRVVLIDLPQVVDIVVNPQGHEYVARDCRNLCAWFTRRGLEADPEWLTAWILDARP
jgi:RIO kinase 1